VSGWKRIKVPELVLKGSPETRGWQREVRDGHLSVLLSIEDGLAHLSISHRRSDGTRLPGRYPTWEEIKDARYRFAPLDVTMAMLLPPQDQYVNDHPTTFHLWQVTPDMEALA
jgi:hypothetical protein